MNNGILQIQLPKKIPTKAEEETTKVEIKWQGLSHLTTFTKSKFVMQKVCVQNAAWRRYKYANGVVHVINVTKDWNRKKYWNTVWNTSEAGF